MKDRDKFWLFIIFLLIFSFFLFLKALEPEEVEFTSEKIRLWQKAIVFLNYNNQVQCSGFLVSKDGVVVTVSHLIAGWYVFADHFPILAVDWKKRVFRTEPLAYDSGNDILIVKIKYIKEGSGLKKITYKSDFYFSKFRYPPKEQERVVLLGFPYGWQYAKVGHILSNIKYSVIGININAFPGMSGSVVVSKDGEVLAMLRKQLGVGVLVPGFLIEKRLNQLREGGYIK